MATPANYNFAKSKIDIDQYIDYEILHIYLAERDWPGNNIKYWNSSTPEHQRWRWICFDLDQTFLRTDANTLADATAVNGPTWPNPPWSTLLLRQLLTNAEFKNRFIQRYAFYLSTTFRPDSLEKIVGEFKSALEPEIPRHITKWGGQLDEDSQETWMPPTFNSISQWLTNVNAIVDFIRQRPSYAIKHLQGQFSLKGLAQVTIDSNIEDAGSIFLYDRRVPADFKGNLFKEIPLLLRAIPKPGYRFVRWELTGSAVKTDPVSEFYITVTGPQEITAVFEKSGTNEPVIIINEINYNSDFAFETGDWVELCNRQDAPVDVAGWKLRDSNEENEYVLPMGTVIPAGGYLAICQDIDAFTSHYNHIMHYRGNTGFGFRNGGEVLRVYNTENILIDSVRYDNKTPWPELPDGKGYTLVLKQTDLDNDIAENWTSQLKGTPGVANYNLTGINDRTANEMIKNNILQNYPNPCNTLTKIGYNIVAPGVVRIRLFDINGRQIKVLANAYQEPGSYLLELDVQDLKTGIYFYTMEVGKTYSGMRKFAVIN